MHAIELRTEYMRNPLGLDIPAPFLSWKCAEGIRQTAYRILAYEASTLLWDSGKVCASSMGCSFGAPLKSRQRVMWQVRLWDEGDREGAWSEEAVFEMAFLTKDCWQGQWINPEPETDASCRHCASYLKKAFTLKDFRNGRLYITCHGVYAAYLNGKRVSDFILAPGTTEYARRLHYQVYDVTHALQSGENTLLVVLGDGWYRGNNGVDGNCNLFGTDISLLCQLETDGQVQVVSDESWQASQDGAIRLNDLQDGEVCEAFRGTGKEYHGVRREAFGYDNLHCSNSVPVQEQERFSPVILTTPKGEQVLDFGQNMAGYVEFSVEAREGQTVRMVHGEALDGEGNFTIANFQPTGRRRKEIRQEILYTCKEGLNRYKPTFCFFGFQYVKVETDIPLERFAFTAHALYSSMTQTGWFTCGHEGVNQLVQNTLWSQKSNFLDIPTDCPTRERQGWTGDAGIFVKAGLYLMDCAPVFRKWLGNVRCTQRANGNIRGYAPRTDDGKGIAGKLDGAAGWSEACILVPYALYGLTGNPQILEENYEMMTRWMDFAQRRAKKNRWRNLLSPNPYKRYTVDTGFHWGEWCQPDVPTDKALLHNVLHGDPELATAYYFYSARLMAKIAEILRKPEDAARYSALSENIRKAYGFLALPAGQVRSDRQAHYVRPLAFGLLSEKEGRETAAALNRLVAAGDYHLNTGFLSTPYLCPVLSRYGYRDTAYRLLLQDSCPGWLYAVKQGANTIWESWNGKTPQGQVQDSLNHYAYGAVVGWLFGGVCGIEVFGEKITIAPEPHRSLQYARAVFDSPLGRIQSGWRYEGNTLHYDIGIPPNAEAELILKDTRTRLTAGHYHFEEAAE